MVVQLSVVSLQWLHTAVAPAAERDCAAILPPSIEICDASWQPEMAMNLGAKREPPQVIVLASDGGRLMK